MTYPEFKEFVLSGVKENWKNDKRITPMIFLLTESNIAVIPAAPFMQSNMHKEVLASILQTVCRQLKVISYCILSESWMSKADKLENFIPPSEDENRQEIIMMFFETKYNNETLYYEIIRDDITDNAIISDLQVVESSSGGKFSNLLIDVPALN